MPYPQIYSSSRYLGLAKYKVVYSDTLYLAVESGEDDYFAFGTLTLTLQSDGRDVYIFDIDPDKFSRALGLSGT